MLPLKENSTFTLFFNIVEKNNKNFQNVTTLHSSFEYPYVTHKIFMLWNNPSILSLFPNEKENKNNDAHHWIYEARSPSLSANNDVDWPQKWMKRKYTRRKKDKQMAKRPGVPWNAAYAYRWASIKSLAPSPSLLLNKSSACGNTRTRQ